MGMEWLWRLAGRAAGPRDGQASGLEAAVLEGTAASGLLAPPPPIGTVRDRALGQLHGVLAAKIAGAHLANRRQVSYPLVLNFGSLSPLEGDFLMTTAGAAVCSEGDPSAERVELAAERLRRLGADERLLARFRRAAEEPASMTAVAARAIEFDKAAHAYAVSLIAIGSRSPVGRLYLSYLAARLGLGQEVVGSLNRRFLA